MPHVDLGSLHRDALDLRDKIDTGKKWHGLPACSSDLHLRDLRIKCSMYKKHSLGDDNRHWVVEIHGSVMLQSAINGVVFNHVRDVRIHSTVLCRPQDDIGSMMTNRVEGVLITPADNTDHILLLCGNVRYHLSLFPFDFYAIQKQISQWIEAIATSDFIDDTFVFSSNTPSYHPVRTTHS